MKVKDQIIFDKMSHTDNEPTAKFIYPPPYSANVLNFERTSETFVTRRINKRKTVATPNYFIFCLCIQL